MLTILSFVLLTLAIPVVAFLLALVDFLRAGGQGATTVQVVPAAE